jgi:hypothetical protein
MPANGAHAIRTTWRGFVMLAGIFFAVCTASAALITAIEAWHEHAQARWPAATAQINSCKVDFAYSEERYVYIVCFIRFFAEKETIEAMVTSRKTRAPNEVLFRWPENQVGEMEMQSWVDQHPKGTSIQVHYDPAKHANVVLVDADMPLGDATTPGNLRILGIFAAVSAPILAVGLIVRRR